MLEVGVAERPRRVVMLSVRCRGSAAAHDFLRGCGTAMAVCCNVAGGHHPGLMNSQRDYSSPRTRPGRRQCSVASRSGRGGGD